MFITLTKSGKGNKSCFDAIAVVAGTGLLVLHYIFKEEYSHIRPFVIIGAIFFKFDGSSSSCHFRSCIDRGWGDGHNLLI